LSGIGCARGYESGVIGHEIAVRGRH
jgi:hypothetical protein